MRNGLRPLAPGNDSVVGRGEFQRGVENIVDVRVAIEIADDIGPFARRGQSRRCRDACRPRGIRRREARRCHRRGRQGAPARASNRVLPGRTPSSFCVPASDADENRDVRFGEAGGHRPPRHAIAACADRRRKCAAKGRSSSHSLAAPPAAVRDIRARQVSWLAALEAGAAFPDRQIQWRLAPTRCLQSRGRPRIGFPTVFPFHLPEGRTVHRKCFPACPPLVKWRALRHSCAFELSETGAA